MDYFVADALGQAVFDQYPCIVIADVVAEVTVWGMECYAASGDGESL